MRDLRTVFGDAVWSLMNNTGSGVVLQVYIVSMPDLGESNIPRFRLCRIYGINEGGVAVTPVAHDTANSITEISAYKGEFRAALDAYGITLNINNYSGVPVSIAEQQSLGILRRFMVGTIHTETAPPNYRCYMQDEIWPGERRMASGLAEQEREIRALTAERERLASRDARGPRKKTPARRATSGRTPRA